jgi:hypothetical protein
MTDTYYRNVPDKVNVTIVPASPGWWAVSWDRGNPDGSVDDIEKAPVVAWRTVITTITPSHRDNPPFVSHEVIPVFLSNRYNADEIDGLIAPDGKVLHVKSGKFFDTIAEMVAWQIAEYAKQEARRVELAAKAKASGCGGIYLSSEELNNEAILEREAGDYAKGFYKQDEEMNYPIGCSNFDTNRAFVFTIEAARVLCGGSEGDETAIRLLRLAVAGIEEAIKKTSP